MLKNFFYFLLLLTYLLSNNALAKSQYVYLDMNLVLNDSKIGKNVIEQLNNQINKVKKLNLQTEKKLKEEENEILSQKNILSSDELNKKIEVLKKKITNYNINKNKKIYELDQKKINSQKQIVDILNPILIDYVEKESIIMILKKDSIIIAPKELNITEDIINQLNEKITKLDIR